MEESKSESYASRLHLPPSWAWKNPDRWLRYLDPDEKIDLPVDDRGFVKTDDAVDRVMDLFKPGYTWEYDPENNETRADDHHFYGTFKYYLAAAEELLAAGDPNALVPLEFRNQPTNMGRMPRQLHNTFHLKTNLVQMPALEPMAEHVANYKIGKQILTKLVVAAGKTIQTQQLRIDRRNDVRRRPEIIKHAGSDTHGQQILNDTFNRHFGNMVNALNDLNADPDIKLILPIEQLRINRPNPHQIIRVGKVASRNAINYVDQIRSA